MTIEKKYWHNCQICSKNISELKKEYGGSGIYLTQVFKKHLIAEHNISITEYFVKICKLKQPECPCNICKKPLEVIIKSSNFRWKLLACGRNLGVLEWSKKAKISRKGSNNPMYQKKSWNKGLTKKTHESILLVSQKMSSRKISNESKKRMSESAKKRTIHGHTGRKHSQETKDKFRIITLNRIKNGGFKQTKTIPHNIIAELLQHIQIPYKEEYILGNWCFDFYLIKENILIEVDGDYWHSNPKIYPNGPITKSQKINHYRDKIKNEYCKQNNLQLLRFWECDIINNIETIKEKLCKLKK